MVKKRAYCCTAMLLVFTMLSSMLLTVAAQANLTAESEPWQPPKNFVDPVTLKIQEFKEQGLDEKQITVELEKLGMGWYPETGATWMGRALTSEELAKMPPRISDRASSDGQVITLQVDRLALMRTSSSSWTGVSAEMVCGSMSVGSGQTLYHYVTVQLGDLSGLSSWAEAVVTHNFGEAYKWYTYDSNEGGWTYYADKNTASSATDTYVIMLDGTQDGGGYHYDVWINYQWVRRAHLPSLYVQAGFQKEVFSDSGTFTNDASHAVFYRNWLHNAQGWSYWTNAVSTQWSSSVPVRESHSRGALSYNWQTWVQN